MLFDLLKKELLSSTILYIGYSHNDPNWKLLVNELIAEPWLEAPAPCPTASPPKRPQ